MSRVKKGGAVAVLLVATVGGAEGLRQKAYPDPATRGKPWTVCYGHTGPEVVPGYYRSLEECKQILLQDLDKHAEPIEKCVPWLKTAPVGVYVGSVSLAVNIGSGGFCKSSIARKFNEGDYRGGCEAFMLYTRAAGITLPGLVRRRQAERHLCLQGLEKGE